VRPATGLRDRLLLLQVLLLLVWAAGVVVVVSQWAGGHPVYVVWLETILSPILALPVVFLLGHHRPDHPITWILTGFLFVVSIQLLTGALGTSAHTASGSYSHPVVVVHDVAQMTFVGFLLATVLLFPTGRLPSARWRPLAALGATGWFALVVALLLGPGSWAFPGHGYPWSLDHPVRSVLEQLGGGMVILVGFAAVAAPFVRLRSASTVERQQLKVFAFAAAIAVLMLVGFGPVLGDNELAGAVVWTIAPTGVLISIGVAVVRYRLYDVDRVISRTMSYAAVTAVLVGLYLCGVLLLTPVVAGVGGGTELAVAASTLAVAAAVRPLRHRVQAAVDRRFNRARYDAQRTVSGFAGRLRDEVHLEDLRAELVSVVDEVMEPESASLWLREEAVR
jgi:hypothetical protein